MSTTVTRIVNITQDDIDQGTSCHCWHCPAAIALNRTFPEYTASQVLQEGIHFYTGGKRFDLNWVAPLPKELDAFVRIFDDSIMHHRVIPISFLLTVELP